MRESEHQSCDVFIIGASLAGSCLARQLKLKHPELRIVVVEKKQEFDYWVGESTLEVFWDYAVRHLNLGHYLDTNHLFKHGLRFFFDSKNCDLPLDKMSEYGRTWYHSVPAHQLDRARFDRDICAMNVGSGIDVRMGCKVLDIQLDRTRGHVIETSKGTFRCRWLVDGGGFAAPLGRKLGLTESYAARHPVSSYWGRYKHLENMDLLGDMDWRGKVNHTGRFLATNHFMYPGYWLWHIPVDATTTSLGVTIQEDMRGDIQIRSAADLTAFLSEHKSFEQILGNRSELVDFQALKALPRSCKQLYSEDRWFMTGMAGSFIEPILSPGCAYLSDSNRMIGDMIATDMRGEERAFRDKVITYNVYSKVWFEAVLTIIEGMYSGSFDVHMMYFHPMLLKYFGGILPISMSERWGYDPGAMRAPQTLESALMNGMAMVGEGTILRKLHARKREMETFLARHNATYLSNEGHFFDSLACPAVFRHTVTAGRELCPQQIENVHAIMYDFCWDYSLRCMSRIAGLMVNEGQLRATVAEAIARDLTLDAGLELLSLKAQNGTDAMLDASPLAAMPPMGVMVEGMGGEATPPMMPMGGATEMSNEVDVAMQA